MKNYRIEAKRLLKQNKKIILPVMIFIGLVQILPGIFSNSVLEIPIGIATMTIGYGYIMASKKVIHAQANELEVSEEGIAGIRKFTQVFSTYFFYEFFEIIVLVILFAVNIFIMLTNSVELIEILIGNPDFALQYIEDYYISNPAAIFIGLFFIVMAMAFVLYYELTYSGSRYLIEHNIRGINALKESRRMMKGHKKQLFSLELSFLPEILLCILVGMIIYFAAGLIPDNLGISVVLPLVVETIAYAGIYRSANQMALYAFYEDLIEPERRSYNYSYDYEIPEAPLEEVTPNENAIFDSFENGSQKNQSVLAFEKISKIKLLLGVILFVPFYLFIGNTLLSLLFVKLPFFQQLSQSESIDSWYNLFYDGAMVLMIFLFFFDFFKNIFQRFYVVIRNHPFLIIIRGYLATYLAMVGANVIVRLLTQSLATSANQSELVEVLKVEPVPISICIVLLAPILEETVFRGVIFRFINQYNRYLAYFVSAFFFGFMHVADAILIAGNYGEFIQILPYFAMGLVFAYFYDKYKTISMPIFFHMLSNTVSLLLILFFQ